MSNNSDNPLLSQKVKLEYDYDYHCFHCNSKFGYIFNSRHHCRNCAASVCWQHSVLNDKNERESRVCSPEFRETCEENRALNETRAELRARSARLIKNKGVAEVEQNPVQPLPSTVITVTPASPVDHPIPEFRPEEVPALLAGKK